MIRLLKHLELLLHQIDQHLMLADMSLAHGLDCTRDPCLHVNALANLTEGSFAEHATDLILLSDVSRVF